MARDSASSRSAWCVWKGISQWKSYSQRTVRWTGQQLIQADQHSMNTPSFISHRPPAVSQPLPRDPPPTPAGQRPSTARTALRGRATQRPRPPAPTPWPPPPAPTRGTLQLPARPPSGSLGGKEEGGGTKGEERMEGIQIHRSFREGSNFSRILCLSFPRFRFHTGMGIGGAESPPLTSVVPTHHTPGTNPPAPKPCARPLPSKLLAAPPAAACRLSRLGAQPRPAPLRQRPPSPVDQDSLG